jgi:osmotically inducible protein OsmC
MRITRRGSALWQGGLKDGSGAISTESGALQQHPYGLAARFQGQRGTNPEELIAAAHAGCFTMSLAMILGEAGLVAERMDTSAEATLEQVAGGWAITTVRLTLRATVPGVDAVTFAKLADMAKSGCPVSKVLRADVSLDAALV